MWNDDEGFLLAGDPGAVQRVVDMLTTIHHEDDYPAADLPTQPVAEALAVYATGFADGATSGQYIRHTSGSTRLLEAHGAIPSGSGGFRAIVHDGNRIAGQLDWEVVSMGPERALAFQNAAIGMALQTAIKNVEAAIERVEDKVDQVIGLIRVGRIGDVIGTRRTLQPLIERLDKNGRISPVDWSTVASLGPAITVDIETLRAQVRFLLSELNTTASAKARAGGIEALLGDGLLAETLALLVVAEHNESLWARLRLAEIDRSDPEHIAGELLGATAKMRSQHDEDQQLLNELVEVGVDLLTPSPLDGFAVMSTRRLRKAESDFVRLTEWFAEQRHLEVSGRSEVDRPTLADSTRHVADRTVGRAPIVRRRLDRKSGDHDADQAELPLGAEPDADEDAKTGAARSRRWRKAPGP